jgi:hypothetical protein
MTVFDSEIVLRKKATRVATRGYATAYVSAENRSTAVEGMEGLRGKPNDDPNLTPERHGVVFTNGG